MTTRAATQDAWRVRWKGMTNNRWTLPVVLAVMFALTFIVPTFGLLNEYVQLILMYVGINIILTASLNLINGYMGEFSVGHAGFMLIGAYVSSILTVLVLPRGLGDLVSSLVLFPIAIVAGGLASALAGLVVAFPSFKTLGDYLAIVTLAFNMIAVSVVQNNEAIGGPRGFLGMDKLTTMPWVFVCAVVAIWVLRNFVYSNFGRGVISIREDETASELVSVDTRQVKVLAFVLSSFFAGAAGALYAHLLQFVTPSAFTILKSTDMLVMVYLGGIGSLGGSILGATTYTVLLEILREVFGWLKFLPFLSDLPSLEVWRWVVAPLMLILLMIFRPSGIMGLREFRWLTPGRDRLAAALWRKQKEVANAPSAD